MLPPATSSRKNQIIPALPFLGGAVFFFFFLVPVRLDLGIRRVTEMTIKIEDALKDKEVAKIAQNIPMNGNYRDRETESAAKSTSQFSSYTNCKPVSVSFA